MSNPITTGLQHGQYVGAEAEVLQLREQLAAERKNNDDWRNTERRVARERDAAVKALKELPEQLLESQKSNPAWSKAELWGIERDILPSLRLLIDAALHKIKQQ